MNKTIVITGAASGIGNHLVHKLSSNFTIFALDVNDTKASDNVNSIKIDMRDENQCHDVFSNIEKIDYAINCAGEPSIRKELISFSTSEIQEYWMSNFSMAFNANKYEILNMRKRKYGKIINIASITAHRGMKHMLAYASAKASIVSMTKIAAIENYDYNIKINSISPATIDTPWISRKNKGNKKDYSKIFYTKSCGTVEDIYSSVIMFLTNNFLTGYDLKLDGGLSDLCKI